MDIETLLKVIQAKTEWPNQNQGLDRLELIQWAYENGAWPV